jgi:proline iminopeptidase
MISCGSHAWQWMYPPVQCHAQGWLTVGDGHEIYWETCGNPMGMPVLFVHGGPGAGCTPDDRRWFDPKRYRIVLFDQRGAGRSRPVGELRANSTPHLLADIEALRRHLRIDRWLLFGGSWGATLSLAYAQRHPEHVRALVLRGVFTASAHERRWLYSPQGAALAYPAAWRRLTATIAPHGRADPLQAIAERLHGDEPAIQQSTAQAWLQWEQDLMDLELIDPLQELHAKAPQRRSLSGAQALAAARIGVHFALHEFFLHEGELLERAGRMSEIPGIIVQGQRDSVTPIAAAEALQRAWPGSRLICVPGAGHASTHGEMARRLIEATDHFSKETSDERQPFAH